MREVSAFSVQGAQETDGVTEGAHPTPSHASRKGTYLQGPASPLTVFVVGGTLESWGETPPNIRFKSDT